MKKALDVQQGLPLWPCGAPEVVNRKSSRAEVSVDPSLRHRHMSHDLPAQARLLAGRASWAEVHPKQPLNVRQEALNANMEAHNQFFREKSSTQRP